MSHLRDPSHPRHAHMFELLRQTHQATWTTHRIKVTAAKHLDPEVARKIQQNAVYSLRYPQFSIKHD